MRPFTLDQDLFDRLSAATGRDLISLFIPTHSKSREVSQDRIRLKNALSDADADLGRLGLKPRQRRDRLRSARELLEDREFWEHQGLGLAVYIDEDGTVFPVYLGYPVDESIVTMSGFRLRPLLGDLTRLEVPVLALTKGAVGLFAATTSDVRTVAADLPGSFDDVNWFVDRERQRQQHPDRAGTKRGRHGHDPSAQEGEDVNRFLREVDQALSGKEPVIVLGDDDLAARFADVTDRPTISPDNSGLRAPFSESEILDIVGPVIAELTRNQRKAALAEAEEQVDAGNATTDVSQALRDALSGRIGHLLVEPGADPIWGRIDESSMNVTTHVERELADVDLVDRVVVESMRNGAEVTPIDDQSSPHSLIAVARF